MNIHAPYPRTLGILAAAVVAAIVLVSLSNSAARHEPFAPTTTAAPPTVASPAQGSSAPSPEAQAAASEPHSASKGNRVPEAPGEAGMVVGIDPETGRLGMPTREQRAELEQISASEGALLSRSSVGLVEEHRADGTVHVNLQGRFQEYATVRINPDGTKTFGCVGDTVGLRNGALDATPVTPAKEER